jgi:hypothetical protein
MENGPIGLPIKNGAFPWRTVKEPEGICLHDWVIYVGQMLVNMPYMEHMGYRGTTHDLLLDQPLPWLTFRLEISDLRSVEKFDSKGWRLKNNNWENQSKNIPSGNLT